MLYFLIDKHKPGKKQINPTFKNLCRQVSTRLLHLELSQLNSEQYVFHKHGDCGSGEQSAEVFARHAPFLLRCMIENEDENVDWKQTNVFIHLRRQFPVSPSLCSVDTKILCRY